MPKRPLTNRQKVLKYLLITYVLVLISFVIVSINAVAADVTTVDQTSPTVSDLNLALDSYERMGGAKYDIQKINEVYFGPKHMFLNMDARVTVNSRYSFVTLEKLSKIQIKAALKELCRHNKLELDDFEAQVMGEVEKHEMSYVKYSFGLMPTVLTYLNANVPLNIEAVCRSKK